MYLLTSYCSTYGSDCVFLVKTIEDIYYFIINYVIYPSSIFKNNGFSIKDIPSIEFIKNKLDYKNYEINFGGKEILLYEGKRNDNKYYVTVKIMEDIEVSRFDNKYLLIIEEYLK